MHPIRYSQSISVIFIPHRCYTVLNMKTNGNDKTLESYKIFPYVAWTLTFAFAVFVYHITTELRVVAQNLQAQTEFLQESIEKTSEGVQFQNFEKDKR